MKQRMTCVLMVVAAACSAKTKESLEFHGTRVMIPERCGLEEQGDTALLTCEAGERGPELFRLERAPMPSEASIDSEVTSGWRKATDGKLLVLSRTNVPGTVVTDEVRTYLTAPGGTVSCRAVVDSALDLGKYLDICRSLHLAD